MNNQQNQTQQYHKLIEDKVFRLQPIRKGKVVIGYDAKFENRQEKRAKLWNSLGLPCLNI